MGLCRSSLDRRRYIADEGARKIVIVSVFGKQNTTSQLQEGIKSVFGARRLMEGGEQHTLRLADVYSR